MKTGLLLLYVFWLSVPTPTFGARDSAAYQAFRVIAGKLKLTPPQLKKGEYEIRVWQHQGLRYGAAQLMYRVRKTDSKVKLVKYLIEFNKHQFRTFTVIKPVAPMDSMLWNRLIRHDMLTLPSESAIYSQLHPVHKDSAWTVIEPDGTINVKAKKMEPSMWVSDGEAYYFEVYGANSYHTYKYSNPHPYAAFKPKITELQKVVAILNELYNAFSP